jgi:hypothetical protein
VRYQSFISGNLMGVNQTVIPSSRLMASMPIDILDALQSALFSERGEVIGIEKSSGSV